MAWYRGSDGVAPTSPTQKSGPSIPVTDMLQLIVLLMWTCLRLTVKSKNPIFDLVFPSLSVITELISSCGLVCCPGLFDILQASTAPTLSQLKSLPTNLHKRWGVYLLVLEKPSYIPRIYIESGTGAAEGVSHRMNTYENLSSLPKYVQAAIDEDYIITHLGLLVWEPIPSTKYVPIRRALFFLLEATLYFTSCRSAISERSNPQRLLHSKSTEMSRPELPIRQLSGTTAVLATTLLSTSRTSTPTWPPRSTEKYFSAPPGAPRHPGTRFWIYH